MLPSKPSKEHLRVAPRAPRRVRPKPAEKAVRRQKVAGHQRLKRAAVAELLAVVARRAVRRQRSAVLPVGSN